MEWQGNEEMTYTNIHRTRHTDRAEIEWTAVSEGVAEAFLPRLTVFTDTERQGFAHI